MLTLWHRFIIWYKGKEVCMGCMGYLEIIWRSNYHISCTVYWTRWWCGCTRKVYNFTIWSDQQFCKYWWITCLPRKDTPWSLFLLPEQLWYSILKGLCTKEGIAGVRHFKIFLLFSLQGTGDGLIPVTGHLYRQLCQKLPLQQGSSCTMLARKGVEDNASARRQL